MRTNWCWAVAFLGLVILLGASVTAATIEVSQPVQVTTSDRYDRNPSVFKKDGTIWVFFVRATSAGSHDPDGYNPDADTYDVYYTTSMDNGVTWSAPVKVANASTGQRGMAAFVDNTGKIWVFVSAPGATDIKYTTSADNGATWSPLTDTGFAGSHVDAFQASDGKIWVFYEDGGTGIEAIKSADGGATWTHVTNISPSPNDGIPKAMEADGKIYVVWCNWNVGGKVWYTYSTDGLTGDNWAAATELVNVPGTIMCDPVMIKSGAQYILFYAPWDQGTDAQWIEVITSTDLANWSARRRVTNGGYGTTYWWDMWPEVLLGSDTLYLFYGSEKHGTERGDGNIFMYEVDWDLTHDHFEAIQPAIDFASDGDTINVAAGTYHERVTVDKPLTLLGANAGIPGYGARGPESIVDADDPDGPTWVSAFFVTSGNVTIDGFKTIDADEGIHVACDQPSWGDRENVVIKNNYIDTEEGQPKAGIAATGIVFYGLYAGAGAIYSVSGAVVQDNYIKQAHVKDAIWFQDVHGSSITIKGNKVDNPNGNSGIILGGSSDAAYVDLSGTVIEDNVVVSGSANGIGVQLKRFTTSSPPVSIIGNTLTGGGMGVRLWSGDGETVIQGNTITNNASGIVLGRDATHTVTNVSIVGNDILNNIADTGILIKDGSATGNEAHFNNIVGNDIGVKNEDPDDTFDAESNWWGDASGPSGVGPGTGDAVSDNVDYDPWLGAGVEESESVTITGDGAMEDTATGGDVTIDATGEHTITIAKYIGNPAGPPTFNATGDYYDVHLDTPAGVNILTVEFCPATTGTTIWYWDGAAWRPCSDQVFDPGPPPCVVVTITTTTAPSLEDLTGLYFAVASPAGVPILPPIRFRNPAPEPYSEIADSQPVISVEVVFEGDGAGRVDPNSLEMRVMDSEFNERVYRVGELGVGWDGTAFRVDLSHTGQVLPPGRVQVYVWAGAKGYSIKVSWVWNFSVVGGTHSYPGGWNLVSIPLASTVNITGWTPPLYRWNPGAGSYNSLTDPNSMAPHYGYWLYANSGGATMEVTGSEVTSDVTVNLPAAGWNMVSAPWGYPVSAIQFTRGTDTKTWDQAVAAGWIADVLWGYTPGSGYSLATVMDPWQGYWLLTRVDGLTMTLRYADRTSGAAPELAPRAVPEGAPVPPAPPAPETAAGELVVANFPNPVTDVNTTVFRVLGPMAAMVEEIRVRIFDLAGQLVWEGSAMGAGLVWQTESLSGEFLANGVYLYQAQVKVAGEWITTGLRVLAIYR